MAGLFPQYMLRVSANGWLLSAVRLAFGPLAGDFVSEADTAFSKVSTSFWLFQGFTTKSVAPSLIPPYGKVNVGISGEQHYGQGGTLLLYFMEPV